MKVPAQRALLAAGAASALLACPAAVAETYEVTLEGISFWYNGQENLDIELFIEPGDTIRWLWIEGFHNVVSGFPGGGDEGELFSSGPPTGDPGTIFEFTFLEPGLYFYHCHPHQAFGMISSVTVLPGPGGLALLAAVGLLWRRRRRSSRGPRHSFD